MDSNNFNPEMGTMKPANGNQLPVGAMIGGALTYFFTMFAFILFICPFSFWKGASYRLYTECKNKSLMNLATTSRWPFLSFLKKIFFEFMIDGSIFISYFAGIIAAVIALFSGGFLAFILTLIGAYYLPMILSWIRDIFVLLLLPFQKFLSWVSKPAQHLDVDFRNKA